jgi:hypothetical protein
MVMSEQHHIEDKARWLCQSNITLKTKLDGYEMSILRKKHIKDVDFVYTIVDLL